MKNKEENELASRSGLNLVQYSGAASAPHTINRRRPLYSTRTHATRAQSKPRQASQQRQGSSRVLIIMITCPGSFDLCRQ
eukprot:1161887-Pleurochrysis_carterae.AAC.3